jgi:hypothetical protein
MNTWNRNIIVVDKPWWIMYLMFKIIKLFVSGDENKKRTKTKKKRKRKRKKLNTFFKGVENSIL